MVLPVGSGRRNPPSPITSPQAALNRLLSEEVKAKQANEALWADEEARLRESVAAEADTNEQHKKLLALLEQVRKRFERNGFEARRWSWVRGGRRSAAPPDCFVYLTVCATE